MRRAVGPLLTSLALLSTSVTAAEPPKVEEFRISKTHRHYFHVRFKAPDDLLLPAWGKSDSTTMARLPRLISDRHEIVSLLFVPDTDATKAPLEFVGIWPFKSDAANWPWEPLAVGEFRLVYPRAAKDAKNGDPFEHCTWVETPVVLRRADARQVRAPDAPKRKVKVASDDLEGLFFAGLQARFAHLQRQAPDFGFYAFAQLAIARKHGLPTPALPEGSGAIRAEYRQFYETLTGGSALTDSLQINRLLRNRPIEREERTVPVKTIEGVTIREHDWKKMMGERKPADEPLARFIPADNYYVRLRNLDAVMDVGELLDLWGNNLLHAFEYRTRDYRLRDRYETQLCLPTRAMHRQTLRDAFRGIAITGSDPYLREGTDLTVILRPERVKDFLKIHDGHIDVARPHHKLDWHEAKSTIGDVAVESFTTPLREISLHRAVMGDYVLVSNSLAGLRRAIEAKEQKAACLADSLDFQYMRTCFRADDRAEHGFAFLPDAFIRRLASPTDRIKQSRRAEALAALHLTTNAGLLRAWTDAPARDNAFARWHGDYLSDAEMEDPEGKEITWNTRKRVAVSGSYGTIHFATPLIEQPIDRVTKSEKASYETFSRDYLRLWSQFFDPVGLRFHQDQKSVKFEAYILPLVSSEDYRWLRSFASGGTVKFDASKVTSKTVLHFLMGVEMGGFIKIEPGSVFLRVEDSPLLKDFAKLLIENERAGRSFDNLPAEAWRKFLQMPAVIGVEGDTVKSVKELLPLIRQSLQLEDIDLDYRGVKINGRKFIGDDPISREVNPPDAKERFHPTFYYAEIGKGLYFAFRPEPLKEMIDQHKDRKKEAKPQGDEVNAALRFLPSSAENARDALQMYFEWQTHRRALPTNAVWHALERTGAVAPGSSATERRAAAMHYLGYLPVSPDGSEYYFDPKMDEVVNRRHGSWRQPMLWPSLAADAPLQSIFDRLDALQFQLRFREDGVHTTIIWEKR